MPEKRDWVTPAQIAKAREIDLCTYLRLNEPGELVHVRGDVYTTRTHDSLKISESKGKWLRWSTGDGGHTALDFLVKVRGWNFQEAVRHLCGYEIEPPAPKPTQTPNAPIAFALPERHINSARVIAYLLSRGIDKTLLYACIKKGILYQDTEHNNCVFIGMDDKGKPCNAMLRSTNSNSTFLREVNRSDKQYTFRLILNPESSRVMLFESCIDLLSYITIQMQERREWRDTNYVSLNGVYRLRKERQETTPPQALEQYLKNHPQTRELFVCTDNDKAGRDCAELVKTLYAGKYTVIPHLPKEKDYNQQLMQLKAIPGMVHTRGVEAMER